MASAAMAESKNYALKQRFIECIKKWNVAEKVMG